MLTQKFYKDFQEFVFTNKILSASSGFIIGLTTKEYIYNILNEIVFPLFTSYFEIENNNIIISKIFQFIKFSFTWIFTIILSFVILEYIFNRKILSLSSNIIDKGEKIEFVKKQIDAKTSNILPDDKDIKKIKQEEDLIYKKIQEKFHTFD